MSSSPSSGRSGRSFSSRRRASRAPSTEKSAGRGSSEARSWPTHRDHRMFHLRVVCVTADAMPSTTPAAGPAVAAAGPVLSDPPDRLFRGDRQRAWSGVALRRQPVAARVSAPGHGRAGARPFLAEQDRSVCRCRSTPQSSPGASAWPSTAWSRVHYRLLSPWRLCSFAQEALSLLGCSPLWQNLV